jgi:hypothetical protein
MTMRAGVKEKCGWNNKIAHDKFEITTKKSKVKTKIKNFLHLNTRAISSSKLSSEFGRENELDGCKTTFTWTWVRMLEFKSENFLNQTSTQTLQSSKSATQFLVREIRQDQVITNQFFKRLSSTYVFNNILFNQTYQFFYWDLQ